MTRADNPAPARNIAPTRRRRWHDTVGHAPPAGGRDNTGTAWQGTSRVVDPAGRRRLNRRTWRRLIVKARRTANATRQADWRTAAELEATDA